MGRVGRLGRVGRVGKREGHLSAWLCGAQGSINADNARQCKALGSNNPD